MKYNLYTTVNIYPNPASNTLHITTSAGNAAISIFGEDGRLVKQLITKGSVTTMDVSNWSKGIYIVNIKSGNQVIVKKIEVN